MSAKTDVIEALFRARYRHGTIPAARRVVTLADVSAEITRLNRVAGQEVLSSRNPANFMKDIVRNETRNQAFPQYVVSRGWTARQKTGGGDCFEFIQLPPGQTTAFEVLAPPAGMIAHPIQSLSLVPAARRYGRRDESWLTQVVTDLSVVQTHFATRSLLLLAGIAVVASHIKLGRGEADALYYAEDIHENRFLLACEMKHATEVLDQDQILRVALAVAAAPGTIHAGASVVPVGVKVAYPGSVGGRNGLLWVREYDTAFPPLTLMSESLYELLPPVPGID